MELFDTHAHLESRRFDDDRQEVIERARAAGVTRIITCGSDQLSSEASLALARSHDGLYCAVGVHAHQASSVMVSDSDAAAEAVEETAMLRLRDLAADPNVVAIGEIGLDYHYDFSPRDAQRAVLARQLELARELDLPVILHNREADEDMRAVFDACGQGLCGVMHCFLADAEMARWTLDRGLYLGVDGPVTFKNVRHLPPILREAPLERLLLETDCPYLAPHPLRGKRNEPAFLPHVAERLAEVLGVPLESIAAITTANACRLFGVN